jgi:hypothetical protein
LCKEFDFCEIAAKLSKFRPLMGLTTTRAHGHIAAFEEKANQHVQVIVILQDKVTQLSTDFGRLVGEVSALRSASAGIQTLSKEISAGKMQIGQKLNNPGVEQLSTDFSELQKEISTVKARIAAMLPSVTPSQNQLPPPSPSQPTVPSIDSQMISVFLGIFAEFRNSRFSLVGSGGRDGLKVKEFDSRCDGHANTQTVIFATKENMSGGFTRAE